MFLPGEHPRGDRARDEFSIRPLRPPKLRANNIFQPRSDNRVTLGKWGNFCGPTPVKPSVGLTRSVDGRRQGQAAIVEGAANDAAGCSGCRNGPQVVSAGNATRGNNRMG